MFDLVSVILPTRNRVALLTEQLEALALQTYADPWELIVVDNGSADDTREVATGFAHRLPLQVMTASDRMGASYARNCGAHAANGDYLFFVDDDDRVSPGWLAAMVVAAQRWDVLRGQLRHFRAGRRGEESVPTADFDGLFRAFDFLTSITGANSGIRRDLFMELGGFDERYPRFEDTEMYWRAQLAGHEPGFVADAVLHYRLRAGVRAVFDQCYRDEKVGPQLYREYRAVGMPRSSTRKAVRAWAGIVKNAPLRLGSEQHRDDYVREVARRLGRIVGSIRHRVVYL